MEKAATESVSSEAFSLAGDVPLESIVCAYVVRQVAGGYRAVLRADLPAEIVTDSRMEMRARLLEVGKFARTPSGEQPAETRWGGTMPPTAQTAGDRRDELEHHTEQDMLGEVLGDFREGWEIKTPPMRGEPWTAEPRRTGLPYVTGAGLTELRDRLRTEAKSAGLADMLALEAGFPGWRVWRSSHGAWWANRVERLTLEMQDCGLHATVGDVRRAADLRALLAEQAELEEWAAGHDWQIPGEQARRELGLEREPSEFRNAARGPGGDGGDSVWDEPVSM